MITKPTVKKVQKSKSNMVKVLYYLPYDEVKIYKEICHKNKISCSEQLAKLLIKFIGEDCIK